MTNFPADLQTLERMRSGADLLSRWGDKVGHAEGSLLYLEDCLLESTRTEPARSEKLLAKVRQSVGRHLKGVDEARFVRLQGHVTRLVGKSREAVDHYAEAWRLFLAAGEAKALGPTAIGWVDALTLSGQPEEALEVGSMGRRFLKDDPLALARLNTNLATTMYSVGQYRDAAKRYREAARVFKKAKQPWALGLATFNLGNALFFQGDYEKAKAEYSEARRIFKRRGFKVPELYAQYSLAAIELVQGNWDKGSADIRACEDKFASLGDDRAVAAMNRELAGLFASLGAIEGALPAADRALKLYKKLGLGAEAAKGAELHGRLLASAGSFHDAEVRFEEALTHFRSTGNTWAKHHVQMEKARVHVLRGDPKRALLVLSKSRPYLERRDPKGAGALSRVIAAEANLALGRLERARSLAARAHKDATAFPATLERPWVASVLARVDAARGSKQCLKWASRSIDELEDLLKRFGRRGLRGLAAGSRDRIYRSAIEIVLEHGGTGGAAKALDLLSQARSPGLIEDMLAGRDDLLRGEVRSAVSRLRDRLLAEEPGQNDVRFRSLRGEINRLESNLSLGPKRAPSIVKEAMSSRTLGQWRKNIPKNAEVVFYHEGTDGWGAFKVRKTGKAIYVPLPKLEASLRSDWMSLRLLLETAARAPKSRRKDFLARTELEALDSVRRLYENLVQPLKLVEQEVLFIPVGALHGVPLEAIAQSLDDSERRTYRRLPHPAVAQTKPSPRKREALLLHGGEQGGQEETREVEAMLRRAGFKTSRTGKRGRLSKQEERLGVLHVAAHGTFHRKGWLYSGLRLADGWVGFEQLNPEWAKGSLLYFASCESGLAREMPGAELDGWLAAGLGAGAREMLLTLWKVDDASAKAFANAFYPAWGSGSTATEAARAAREELRAHNAHPFYWAPYIAVG